MLEWFGDKLLREIKEKWQYNTEHTHTDIHMNTHIYIAWTHSDLIQCAYLPCKTLY